MIDYNYPRKRKNHFWLKILLLSFLVIVLFAVSTIVYAYSKISKPRTSYSAQQTFEIKKGESFSAVADRLEQSGLIGSSIVLKIYSTLQNTSNKVQAGIFSLNSNMTPKEILQVLISGRTLNSQVRITFKEGDTIADYGRLLAQYNFISEDEFIKKTKIFSDTAAYPFLNDKPPKQDLQGYLFPDTYAFGPNANGEDVIKKMLDNFGHKVTPQMRQQAEARGMKLYDIITLASIIEGEVGRNLKAGTKISAEELENLKTERRLVAGVLYNRLNTNHALESDATITFVTGQKKAQTLYEDLKINSPYNTYLNRGLPPGPINNPSLDSILAAISPTDTDYYYFLSKPSGEMVFSKTLEEHNSNKARYLP